MQLVVRLSKLKAKALRVCEDKFSLGSTARSPKEDVMKFNLIAQSSLVVLSLVAGSVHSFAAEAPYCIAVNGGFGNGGTTFVARNFSLPTESKCSPWTGYTKTASTVILTTNGTSCLSTDSKALTVSVTSADPSFIGAGHLEADYIQMSRGNSTEPFSGQDYGYFAGNAEPVTCSSDLLTLPSSHD